MTDDHKKNDKDWVDTIADIAAAFGFNRVQVRWRLDKLRRSAANSVEQTKGKVSHIRYANKVCPHCYSVNDADAKRCARCDRPLTGRIFQIMSRIGILTPQFLSVSSLIVAAIMIIYARMVMDMGGGFSNLLSIDTVTLFKFGASYAGAYHNGEWHRLLTSVLLHAGIWHLGFNLLALTQLGPFVEELFGKARMIVYFVLTGIAASAGSLLFRGAVSHATHQYMDLSVAIGASGAIMGLMGIMAGWGHRDGTGIGGHARNTALKWGLYTLVFGFIIGADNAAHVSGFLVGAVIGLMVNPMKIRNRAPSPVIVVLSLIAGLMLTGAAAACVLPLPSPLAAPFEKIVRLAEKDPSTYEADVVRDICTPLREGRKEDSEHVFLAVYSPNVFVSKEETDRFIQDMCVVPREDGEASKPSQ